MAFFGADQTFSPVETVFWGIHTPQDLYRALEDCWCAETCAPRMREKWRPEDPTFGQCSITAFLAQDLFGGQVRGVPLPKGFFHCFNVLENGQVFDLTSEQFLGEPLDYAHTVPQRREDHFAAREKYERYLLLKDKLTARLKMES